MFSIKILTIVMISAFEDIYTSKEEWNFLVWLWAFEIAIKSYYLIRLIYKADEFELFYYSSALVFILSVCSSLLKPFSIIFTLPDV